MRMFVFTKNLTHLCPKTELLFDSLLPKDSLIIWLTFVQRLTYYLTHFYPKTHLLFGSLFPNDSLFSLKKKTRFILSYFGEPILNGVLLDEYSDKIHTYFSRFWITKFLLIFFYEIGILILILIYLIMVTILLIFSTVKKFLD